MQLSEFIARVEEPQTILMAKLSRELKAKGIDVVDLSLGEPDFDTPQHIKDAAIKAINEGFTKYTPVAGIPDLRSAVCTKLKAENNLDYLPENIVVSTGAKQSLANVILSMINPGDEVIIPTPYWVTYSSLVQLAGGVCRFVHCEMEDGFKISPEKLQAAITPKTKMFIFSSPSNPTGAIYSKEELSGLKEIFKQNENIYIVSDEIYEYINYVSEHNSLAQFTEIKDRVIVVNGFSKGFAMTGWRLGYIAAPKEIAQACEKLQSQITSGTNSIAQKAAVAALLESKEPSKEMVKVFKERRDYFINALQDIKGLKLIQPDGAFYAFADISYYLGKTLNGYTIENVTDFTMYLLNVAHVTGVAGTSFGNDKCIRFSYATSLDKLKEAVTRIKKAVE